MKNITAAFGNVYVPQKALVVYRPIGEDKNLYIEAFDMDGDGKPINAHPLSRNELAALAEQLNAATELSSDYLTSKGLLPGNVLYVDSRRHCRGYAVWYTPPQKVKLFFKKELSIPSGEAFIPAMVWRATKNELEIFALRINKKPDAKTALYNAPFFNVHENGVVCMGTVDINIESTCCLEEFMARWQDYFFNSYFSHLIGEHSPTRGNIVQLWQQLVNTGKKFPAEILVKNGRKIKDLII